MKQSDLNIGDINATITMAVCRKTGHNYINLGAPFGRYLVYCSKCGTGVELSLSAIPKESAQ